MKLTAKQLAAVLEVAVRLNAGGCSAEPHNKDAAPTYPNHSTLVVFTAIKRDVPVVTDEHYREVMDLYEAVKSSRLERYSEALNIYRATKGLPPYEF